ncbi:MAG: hypothetical protein HKN85_08990 [Gammaproteobacteria bacterium]|nr:hypothetical protein [Gammaproteobacteria bacterium]
MLIWIAVIIAALALLRAWQIYSREKTSRELKAREIARRLKAIEEKKPKMKKGSDE